MALVSAARSNDNLIPLAEYQSRKREEARARDDADREATPLTEDERERFEIIRHVTDLYDQARKAREPFNTFDVAWDLFMGNVWPNRWPTWRAKITIQKIRAFCTFMTAIMTDNKPRLTVEPRAKGTEDAADLLHRLVDRDWDENQMQAKVSTFVLFGLIWGTAFMKITYDPFADNGRGKHLAAPIVPYRIYSNRTASGVEDAEYILHVEDVSFGWIRRNFPDKANVVRAVQGQRSGYKHERDRDYIREGDPNETAKIISAQNVNGNIVGPMTSMPNPQYFDADKDEVEVIECWLQDDTLEGYERQKVEDGHLVFEPMIRDDGEYQLESAGVQIAFSEIDGAMVSEPLYKPKMKPVMETARRLKYPNGRVVLIAGGRVLLRDIPSPFQIDGFPFAMWKDYDIGTFWGQGEALALKDCAIALNKIASQIYDILEKTGNPTFKLKKGAGVNSKRITNRPGLIIPMDEMDALAPLEKPPMPPQFLELYNLLRQAMGDVSGVNDSVQGQLPAANTAFATMDQLQESGAAAIRLKVRNLEAGLTRIGKLRVQLIQQYDSGERPVRMAGDGIAMGPNGQVVQPAAAAQVEFRQYSRRDLQGPVEFGIVPISSLSTSPAGLWNRWMTMLDKHLVDEWWWHSKFRVEGWRTELPRMMAQRVQAQAREAAAKAASKAKPGPTPRNGLPPRRPGPRAQIPTRRANALVR